MRLLHLSDLHFGTFDDANLWFSQLAADLQIELGCSHLDALVVSGDIANRSTTDEYKAAEHFFKRVSTEFRLLPEQIVIVPGNHDVSWHLAKKAYAPKLREEYKGPLGANNRPDRNSAIDTGGEFIEVQSPAKYQQRFKPFSEFYLRVKGAPYPLAYDQQAIIYHLPAQNLLILGLNSAWQLDHHYTARAGIHPIALGNALQAIRHEPSYAKSLKFVVWHHPITSPDEDRITDTGFLQLLAQAGFCLVMHGHIHKAENGLYRYDVSATGRKLEIVGAGTFGSSTRELVAGYPWQYQLLSVSKEKVIVETRCRTERNGAWRPDARWTRRDKDPEPRYDIRLPQSRRRRPTAKLLLIVVLLAIAAVFSAVLLVPQLRWPLTAGSTPVATEVPALVTINSFLVKVEGKDPVTVKAGGYITLTAQAEAFIEANVTSGSEGSRNLTFDWFQCSRPDNVLAQRNDLSPLLYRAPDHPVNDAICLTASRLGSPVAKGRLFVIHVPK